MRTIKLPLEAGLNTLPTTSSKLKLLHIEHQRHQLMGWFCETQTLVPDSYQVYIALTGEVLNPEYNYVTSTQLQDAGGFYVVHAFD